jgi:hypothetical protein
MYSMLISTNYKGGPRQGESGFAHNRSVSSEGTRVAFVPVGTAGAASFPHAGGATENVTVN